MCRGFLPRPALRARCEPNQQDPLKDGLAHNICSNAPAGELKAAPTVVYAKRPDHPESKGFMGRGQFLPRPPQTFACFCNPAGPLLASPCGAPPVHSAPSCGLGARTPTAATVVYAKRPDVCGQRGFMGRGKPLPLQHQTVFTMTAPGNVEQHDSAPLGRLEYSSTTATAASTPSVMVSAQNCKQPRQPTLDDFVDALLAQRVNTAPASKNTGGNCLIALRTQLQRLNVSRRHMLLDRFLQDPSFPWTKLLTDPQSEPVVALVNKTLPEYLSAVREVQLPTETTEHRIVNDFDTVASIELHAFPQFDSYSPQLLKNCSAVIQLKAACRKDMETRAGVSITCVVDVSGSMAGSKLALTKSTVHFLIDQLSDKDMLAFVSFNDKVETLLPLLVMTAAARKFAHAVIDGVSANGGTALYDGLVAGVNSQLEAAEGGKYAKCVLLCTDGVPTQGPRDVTRFMTKFLNAKKKWAKDITVKTFGFGDEHDVKILQRIAEVQQGRYTYLTNPDDIPAAFGDALGDLFSTVATDILLTLEPLGGGVIKTVTPGMAPAVSVGQIQMKYLAAGVSREFAVAMDLPHVGDTDTKTGILRATLEFKDLSDPNHVRSRRITKRFTVNRDLAPGAIAQENCLAATTLLRFKTAHTIEKALQLLEKGGDIQKSQAVELMKQHVDQLTMQNAKMGSEIYMFAAQSQEVLKQLQTETHTYEEELQQWARIRTASFSLYNKDSTPVGVTSGLPSDSFYSSHSRASILERFSSNRDGNIRHALNEDATVYVTRKVTPTAQMDTIKAKGQALTWDQIVHPSVGLDSLQDVLKQLGKPKSPKTAKKNKKYYKPKNAVTGSDKERW